jgi:hypothetical protein
MAEQEEYVRLRAGRDGGEYVVPTGCLVEMSATMRGESAHCALIINMGNGMQREWA